MHQVGFGRKRESFQHEGNTRGTTFPVLLRKKSYCKREITSNAENKRVF